MPDVADQPPQPNDRHGRRIYVYWAVALTLLVLLGIFCWAVVVPVWQTNTALRIYSKEGDTQAVVRFLGGEEQAGRALSAYLRAPHWLTDDGKRTSAVYLLGSTTSAAVPLLVGYLKDDDKNVRSSAISALHTLGPKATKAIPHLLELLDSRYPRQTRLSTVHALGEIAPDDRRIVLALGAIATDNEGLLSKVAINVLGKAGPNAAPVVDALTRCLRSAPGLREESAWALKEVGPAAQTAIPALAEAIGDPEPIVRVASAAALWKVTGEVQPSLKTLVSALDDADPRVAGFAIKGIAEIGPPAAEAAPVLVAILRGRKVFGKTQVLSNMDRLFPNDPKVQKAYENMITALSEDLGNAARALAAHALGCFGVADTATVEALQDAAEDSDPTVRSAAAEALKKIKGEEPPK